MFHFKTNLLRAEPALGKRRVRHLAGILTKIALSFLAVVLLLGVVSLPFFWAGRSLVNHVEAGRSDLLAAESYASQLMIGDALKRLELAETEFFAARRNLAQLRLLAFIPYAQKRIQAAESLFAGGLTAVSAVRDALQAIKEVLELTAEGEGLVDSVLKNVPTSEMPFSDLSAEKKRAVLAALARSAPRLSESVSRIAEALVALDEVPADVLDDDLLLAIDAAKIKLRSARSTLTTLAVIADHLPSFLGYPDQRNYLFFFENNTELRPTGGFLGVYGLVQVKDAEILSVKTDDIYALDGPSESAKRPAPPEPIAKYINVDSWYLRDANWSPDFPTSAAVMEQFYYEEAQFAGLDPQPIDGIIVITPQLAEDLLRLTGPVTVSDKTFTTDNLVDELEFAVEVSFREEGIPFFARKTIVSDLVNEVIHRLTAQPLSKLLATLQVLEKNLARSHILLWLKDPNLQSFVLQMDWGGQIKNVRGDYVTVIDANLASLKSDPAVERSINYSLMPTDHGFDASVAITYDHHGSFDWKTTRYRTYTRIYVPAGSELIGVEGAMFNDKLKDPARRPGAADVYSELGRTAFGAFISIEPG
ncbi:DUF4012 domain-containing protein, partial [Patescibacteria group bacterium]|nr:DUF4012 domain-containing protein [Patescibacteria group bacterium]